MIDHSDKMAPEASPGEAVRRVRRVNNMPMIIGGIVVCVFLLVMMMVAVKRAHRAPVDDTKKNAKSTSLFARQLINGQDGGIVKPSKPLQIPDMPNEAEPQKENLQHGQLKRVSISQPSKADEEADKIRLAKMQKLEEAAQAKTGVQVTTPRSTAANNEGTSARPAELRQQQSDPMETYKEKLAEINSLINRDEKGEKRGDNPYEQFNKNSLVDRWKLGSEIEPPRSQYELRAGFVIPATMISGINSELPGQIIAQVSQPVYDTPTGKYLLIPQGSRLVGSYSSDVTYGQSRVLIAWQRIIFPDGKALDIGSMPGADSAGYSGFYDQVNNHYLRLFGSAIMMSGVVAGVTLSQDSSNTGSTLSQQRAGDVMSAALGQQLGQVTAEMIRKNMNTSPTLEIRPGYRFNVIVTKDMTFKTAYRQFDYSFQGENR